MATKAELETELTALRILLAESQAVKDVETEPSAAKDDQEDTGSEHHIQAALSELLQGDLGGMTKEITAELEDLAGKKPLLTALGAFLLGYSIGRSR